MQKEIGSEFWSVTLGNNKNKLLNNVTWFISGRAALRAVLQQIPIDTGVFHLKVGLPSFLCESMIEPLEKEKIEYKFYPVEFSDSGFQFDFSSVNDCNVILLLDYFGYESTSNNIPANKIIIRDLTHSVYVRKYNDADYYFGSLRKWSGFIGAGFAFKKDGKIMEPSETNDEYIILRNKAMLLKKKYILGEIDSKEYLKLFHKAELLLEECKIALCEANDVKFAERLDVELLKTIRRENAKILIEGLKKYCIFKQLGDNDCPLCVPIIYEERDELRKYLISKDIYCPIHWPKPKQIYNELSNELYKKELSLVCDQRYTKDDMNRIVDTVLTFMEKNNA